MLVGPGLPDSNLNRPVPQSIVRKNGRYSLVMRGLEHIESAHLPIDTRPHSDLSPATMAFKAADRVFIATSEQYMGTGLLTHSTFKRLVTNNENPGDVIKYLIINRMKEVAIRFLNLKDTAIHAFKKDRLVESRLYRTLCKIGAKRSEWTENLSKMKDKAVFEKKSNREEYSISTGSSKSVYVHHRFEIGKGGCKVIKAGLDIISEASIARLKPQKNIDGNSVAWETELKMFRLLLAEKNKGTDLEGLLKPRDILCFNKTDKETGNPKEQTQVFVDRAKEDLIDRINRGGLDERSKLRICFQVTKGLNTLHQMGYAHRDMKGENVLIDENGQAMICDFGFCKKLSDRVTTYEGSTTYYPPEVIKNLLLNQNNLVTSGAWDSWSLGIVLFMIMNANTAHNAPLFYFDLVKKNYGAFLTDVKNYGTNKLDLNTIEGVIDALLVENPVQRLSVAEAFEAITNIYNRKS